MSFRTNFRIINRIQWAKDVIADGMAFSLQDRVNTLRGKTGIVTCDELGVSKSVWAKMPPHERDNARANFWAALRIKVMTQAEFKIDCASAKKDLGIY